MKFLSKFVLKFVCLNLIFLATSFAVFSQTAEKKVQWQGISGKNDEFYFQIPEDFQAFADGNYFTMTKDGKKVQVDSRRILARYINGVVLMVEFYEGDAKDILTAQTERQKGEIIKDETVNNFQIKSYVEKTPEFIWETQYFTLKNRLYVLQAVSRSENNPLVRNFFESVRLANQKQFAAPNSNADVKANSSTVLPEITENLPERLDDSQPFQGQPDRKVIYLYKPRAKFSPAARRSQSSGTVKLKVLFSSSGKVTKTEVLSSPGSDLTELATKAAEKIQFLPAENDGKLVSTYQTVEYNFSIY